MSLIHGNSVHYSFVLTIDGEMAKYVPAYDWYQFDDGMVLHASDMERGVIAKQSPSYPVKEFYTQPKESAMGKLQEARERIAAAEAVIARESERLEVLAMRPQEPNFLDGMPAVVYFTKEFRNGSYYTDRSGPYHYAAVKIPGNGYWYTTARTTRSTGLMFSSWDDLVDFVEESNVGDKSIWYASEFLKAE